MCDADIVCHRRNGFDSFCRSQETIVNKKIQTNDEHLLGNSGEVDRKKINSAARRQRGSGEVTTTSDRYVAIVNGGIAIVIGGGIAIGCGIAICNRLRNHDRNS